MPEIRLVLQAKIPLYAAQELSRSGSHPPGLGRHAGMSAPRFSQKELRAAFRV